MDKLLLQITTVCEACEEQNFLCINLRENSFQEVMEAIEDEICYCPHCCSKDARIAEMSISTGTQTYDFPLYRGPIKPRKFIGE